MICAHVGALRRRLRQRFHELIQKIVAQGVPGGRPGITPGSCSRSMLSWRRLPGDAATSR